jgi:hypothetical protein
MALTHDELKKELSDEGRLKNYNKELSAYIKKHVKGKKEFVISELVAHGLHVKEPFSHKKVTKKEYVEYLKEKFKDEKDDYILNHGC